MSVVAVAAMVPGGAATAKVSLKVAAGATARAGAAAVRSTARTTRAMVDKVRNLASKGPKKPAACRRPSNSFLPGTLVVMADGTAKPIEEIGVGDLVVATDPVAGVTAAEEVTDLIEGAGIKHLVRVGTDPDGDGVLDWVMATVGRPFWVTDPVTGTAGWTDAGELILGDLLADADGHLIEVLDLQATTRVAVVHNLTVDTIHTYYVLTGDSPLLVHNIGNPACGPRDLRGLSKSYMQAVLRREGTDPHKFKEGFVGNAGGHFDIKKEPGGELFLVNKKGTIVIPTGLVP